MTAALKLGVLWCDSSVIFLFVAKLQNSIFVKLSEYVNFGLNLHPTTGHRTMGELSVSIQ